MTRLQREQAVLSVLRRYTNQAHHAVSDSGEPACTRAEAAYVLGITAAAVAVRQEVV